MAGTCGDDATFDGFADKSHVADDVEQLVACTFVLPRQRLVLDVAQVGCVAVLNVQHICEHIETLLRRLTLINDNGIVKVAALDEISLKQGLDITDEHKGTSTGNLAREILHVVEGGKLRVDEL